MAGMGGVGGLSVGRAATLRFTVTDEDTASALGSGDLPVLGTPRLLAWCEAATCSAVEGAAGLGQTTVGSRVSLDHRAASGIGSEVTVTATLTHVDGRLLRFEVVAVDAATVVVGYGEVTRVVVDRERFLSRVG